MSGNLYRIDKFSVPAAARDEFLVNVQRMDRILNQMEGCLGHRILEQVSGPGEFNIVTIAEWESEAALSKARETMAEAQAAMNFDPKELIARLSIRADIANYAEVSG
ncbi:antibiotic biosynthesis monooxygenase family protein [Rhizobium sp. PAMB 3174]